MDRTADFNSAVLEQATSSGMTEEQVLRLRKAQILRSMAAKSEFIRAASDVLHNLESLRTYIKEHRRDYVQQGRLSEAARDRIEEEVGSFVRSCSANIQRLERSIPAAAAVDPVGANASVVAFRHGVALALSERLQAITTAFDRCRGVRYQQLTQRQAAAARPRTPEKPLVVQQVPQELVASALRASGVDGAGPGVGGAGPGPGGAQALALVQRENQALQQDLLARADQVMAVERTMREVSALNQMFSTQVMHQSEQIEHVYAQAVQATLNLRSGNQYLGKAIKLNTSARKYVLVLLLLASGCLLFLDWYSS